VATSMSTYVIQTVGIPCVARGNVIVLADTEIGVAEACSGLRRMMLFLAVCTGAAFFLRMSWLKGTIVVLSAAPIAIVANVARITATAVLEAVAGHNVAAWVFHDVAGWLMMPLAVVLLWALLAFLNRLLLPSLPGGPVLLGARGAGGDRRRRA